MKFFQNPKTNTKCHKVVVILTLLVMVSIPVQGKQIFANETKCCEVSQECKEVVSQARCSRYIDREPIDK
ncbi:MAG: hypothetical protein FWD97_01700 [Defluviitaleaceae bacterium]|nr:hypothetical protein [Defluviitaleaceae bacterium]